MIIDFSVKNFKGIKDRVTLSFVPENSDQLADYYIIEPTPGLKLLKLGIIYGPNGSGKTTILTALDFLRDLVTAPPRIKSAHLDFEPFLFDQHSKQDATEMELNFVCDGQRYRYTISFNRIAVLGEELRTFSPNKSLFFKRDTDIVKQLSSISFGPKAGIRKSAVETLQNNTLWNSTVLAAFSKTNLDSRELREVTNWFSQILREMVTPAKNLRFEISDGIINGKINKGNMLKFLKKASFKIEDFSVEVSERPELPEVKEIFDLIKLQFANKDPEADLSVFDRVKEIDISISHSVTVNGEKRNYLLDYKSESEGTKRYFQFSGLLDMLIRESRVMTIDELESSLHPDLLKHFLLLYLVNSKQSQLLATTHYRELLLEKDILRHDALWFTDKKADGTTELYSLADFDSSVVRDTTSIFNAYKTGKLGAVPILSDYYLDIDHNTDEEE